MYSYEGPAICFISRPTSSTSFNIIGPRPYGKYSSNDRLNMKFNNLIKKKTMHWLDLYKYQLFSIDYIQLCCEQKLVS